MNEFLAMKINKKCSIPVYKQLGDGLENLIEKGVLKPHYKLPPIRKMSNALKINNVTVINAYKYLENKKIVYSLMGSGTYISEAKKLNPQHELFSNIDLKKINNFSGITPSYFLFPFEDYAFYSGKVLEKYRGESFAPSPREGFFDLRQKISMFLRNYNIDTSAENIYITENSNQIMKIFQKLFFRQEIVIIFQSPIEKNIKFKFIENGYHTFEFRSINEIKKLLSTKKVHFCYVSSNSMNFYGKESDMERIQKLLDLAEEYNFYIIEDDSFGDIYHTPCPPNNIKNLDKNDRVIYFKNFYNTILPGQNMGFCVFPNNFLMKFESKNLYTDIVENSFNQRVLSYYINEPRFITHIHSTRDFFYKKLLFLEKLIGENLKNYVYYSKPLNGLILWLNIDYVNISEKEFYIKLINNGLLVLSSNLFFSSPCSEKLIGISLANLTDDNTNKGILIIKNTIESL